MIRILFIFICNLLMLNMMAQESIGGDPLSLGLKLNQNVPTYTFAALNLPQLIAEDAENGKNGVLERSALIRPANLGLYNSGVWTELENGDRIWRLVIHADAAKAITLLFKDFFLPEGAKLFVYNPNYTQILGAYTSINNRESKQFTTELIHGDKVVLEYYEPASQAFNGQFIVEGVAHFYKDIPWYTETQDFGDSDNCEVNINCSEGNSWQDIKKGVARIFVVAGGSGGWCTGSLVNNTDLNCTPYFLTAFHCGEGSSTSNFNNYVFYFNYEASGCTNPGSQSTITNSAQYFSVTGCSVVSSSNNGGSSSSDFLLVQFNANIPAAHTSKVYYNGWNRTNNSTVTSNGVGIHHPAGDIKKISTYTATLTTTGWNGSGLSSHYEVQWTATANGHGVTEGGSSGSPIFNDQGLIIGTLTGGGSYCNFLTGRDDYGKVSYHWNSNGTANNRRLDIHLDPAGMGSATSLLGTYAPCSVSTALDAQISSITQPSTDICGNAFTPIVILKNSGTNNLTSCQINYQVTGGSLQSYTWSGNLATNATASVPLPSLNAAAGTNTFTAYTQSPNGGTDQNTGNDSKSVTFNAIAGSALPLTQNFQATTFPPTNYSIANADTDITWARTTTAGANSSASMFVDNWDYNASGAYDWFILPSIDLSTASSASMTYDYAYAYYNGTQGTFYDSLAVAYSLDCGASWFALSFEGGTQLATAGGQSTEFVPTANQWVNETVNLNIPALTGQGNVLLAFVAINGYGNNIYVDNINIQSSTTTINPPVAQFSASSTTICGGSQVTFTNSSTNSPTSYSWSFPGGNPSTSTQANPVVTYSNPGTYSVTLTATNGGGSDAEVKTNYIVAAAGPTLSITAIPTSCAGVNTGTATVSVVGGTGSYLYSWTGSSSTNAVATGLAPGNYTATVTNVAGCSSSTSISVLSSVNINVQLSVVDSSLLGGASSIQSIVSGGTPSYTYSWNVGATSSSLVGLGIGTYTLTVTDANGCTGAATASIGGVGIKNPEWLSYVSLYPNPTNDVLNIDLSLQSKQDIQLQVFNAIGQVLYTKSLNGFLSGLETINLREAAEGVYFVRISGSSNTKILRFIKKN